jgi:hypothetical protein
MPEQPWPLGLSHLSHVISRKIDRLKLHSLETQHNSQCRPVPGKKNGDTIGVETSGQGFGEIITRENFIVLKLHGTQFEMGYQHGFLLAKEIHEPIQNPHVTSSHKPGRGAKDDEIKLYPADNQISFWVRYIDDCIINPSLAGLGSFLKAIAKDNLLPIWQPALLADRISDDAFRALYGVYIGYKKGLELRIKERMPLSGDILTMENFIRSYIQPDLVNILIRWALGKERRYTLPGLPSVFDWTLNPIGSLGCTSVGFLPGKSEDGSLLFGNDFDYTPLAGLWEKNLVVVFSDPQPENQQGFYDKNNPEKQILQKYLFITSPGMHASLVGVNESGVAFRVHNNFASDTDDAFQIPGAGADYDPFNKPHGQPLLNFCDTFLRMSRNIAADPIEFYSLKNSIRDRITCIGENKHIKNFPASGWTFLLAQPKNSGNSDESRILVYEATANHEGPAEIPVKYTDAPKERFLLLKDLEEIQKGGNVQAIWQTNFFTSENLRQFEIFQTRSGQLNNINRFLRVGLEVRKRHEAGGVTWKDIANILADDKDIFSGNGGNDGVRRLGINTVAGIANITSVVYSIKPKAGGGRPEIIFYLALPPSQRTPAAWGRYFQFKFDDLDQARSGDNVYVDTKWTPAAHGPNDNYSQAQVPFYEAYCHYTFNQEEAHQIQFLIDRIQDAALKLGKTNSGGCKEPFLDHLLGRLLILKNNMNDRINALAALEASLSNIDLVYDPHLITLTNYFIIKVCGVLYKETKDNKYEDRANRAIQDLNKDLYFEKMILTPELLEAIKPYLKPPFPAVSDGPKLKYVRDYRLMNAILKLKDKKEYGPKDIEDEISFGGVDFVKYRT